MKNQGGEEMGKDKEKKKRAPTDPKAKKVGGSATV